MIPLLRAAARFLYLDLISRQMHRGEKRKRTRRRSTSSLKA